MFKSYHPNVKAVNFFLRQLGVKVNKDTVDNTLQNHPDWPSMLCLSDAFYTWNFPNAAGRILKENLEELPIPFIAHINNVENPLAIITGIEGDLVTSYQTDYKKPLKESRDSFLKKWHGVYLIAEPNAYSGEPKYQQVKRKEFFQSLLPAAVVFLTILLSFFILQKGIFQSLGIAVYFEYLILLAGITVTTILLWYEIDKNNPLLKKVCTGIAKGNCGAILTGKQAKVFSWLSWSEVGFFYFTGSFLLLLFTGANGAALSLLGWLAVLALPYTVYSLFYQWRVAKQWCVLCLGVQALLLLGALNAFANDFLSPLRFFYTSFIFSALLLFALPALVWYAAKPYLLRLQEAKNTKREYLRIKFNEEIFNALLKKEPALSVSAAGLGIDIGNPLAQNTIIKVCNPYCGPCATAHPVIESLLETNKNVKAKIIFTTPNDESHRSAKPTQHLLAIAAEGNAVKTKQALDDWYLPTNKDYEVFSKKYLVTGELQKQGDKMEAMEKWCNATQIAYTPTFFLNGYKLPDMYSIDDLKYFLQE